MAQPDSTALARKLSASQGDQGDRPRSVLRALRLTCARVASDGLQLPMSVIGAKQSCRAPDTLPESIGDDWLMLVFATSDERQAAVCLDVGVVSAIVQVQTFGEVMADAPSVRVFTDTDAAMVSPWVEQVLSRAVQVVEAKGDQARLTGYEFKARLQNLRTLGLTLVEDAYDVFDLTVELAGGVRQGQISFVLPAVDEDQDLDDVEKQPAGPNLEQASGVLRADLNTVICRMSLPFASLSALTVDDVLPLVGAKLDQAEVLTIDRFCAAVGRLGQTGGMRAVRLNEYENALSISDADTTEFLEAHTPTQKMGPSAEQLMDVTPIDPVETGTLGHDLDLGDSDAIAAEISKLAGLGDVPGPAG